jgi:hypothetical protein
MKINVRFKEILGLPTENNLFSHRILWMLRYLCQFGCIDCVWWFEDSYE